MRNLLPFYPYKSFLPNVAVILIIRWSRSRKKMMRPRRERKWWTLMGNRVINKNLSILQLLMGKILKNNLLLPKVRTLLREMQAVFRKKIRRNLMNAYAASSGANAARRTSIVWFVGYPKHSVVGNKDPINFASVTSVAVNGAQKVLRKTIYLNQDYFGSDWALSSVGFQWDLFLSRYRKDGTGSYLPNCCFP